MRGRERAQKIEKEREIYILTERVCVSEGERDEEKKWAIQSNIKIKLSVRYLADPSR